MKVMLVGPGEAGKTTLLNHLLCGKFVTSPGMTDGVAMKTWSPQLSLQELQQPQQQSSCDERKILLSMWDFGGQEIYLNTHPILFSDKTLYLLVWNPRSHTTVSMLEDYIFNIRSRDPLAPILFVTTHRAEVHDREVCRILVDLEKHNLIGHLSVDSCTGDGIQMLVERLIRLVTVDYLHFSRAIIPTWYLQLESALRERSSSQFSMNREEFQALCRTSAPCTSNSTTTTLLFLLHHWGVVFVLPHPNSAATEENLSCGDIVLDPQRLADVFKAVISCHKITALPDCELHEMGVLNHALAPLIWSSYEPHLAPQFLALLHSSELSYEIYDSLGRSTHQSLVPALLPYSRKLTEREIRERIGVHEIATAGALCSLLKQGSVRISFDCLPSNFFPKLVVRLRHLSCVPDISRSSFTIHLALWDSRAQAMVVSAACIVEDKNSNSLTVYPAGWSLDATAISFQTISFLMLSAFPGVKLEELLLVTPGRLFTREELSESDSIVLRDGSQVSLRFLAPLLTSEATLSLGTRSAATTDETEGDSVIRGLSEGDAMIVSKLKEKLSQFQTTGDICDQLSLSRALLDAASLLRQVCFKLDAEPKILWLAAVTAATSTDELPCCRLYAVSPSMSPCLPWEIVWETEVIILPSSSPPMRAPNQAERSLSELYLSSLACLFPGQRLPHHSTSVAPVSWTGVVPCESEECVVAVRRMESQYFAAEGDIFGIPVLYSKDLLARQRKREGVGEDQVREIMREEVEDALQCFNLSRYRDT